MEINIQEILRKHFAQCYFKHDVTIPDKYIPYINSAIKEIITEVLKEAADSAVIKHEYVDDVYDSNYPDSVYKGNGFCSVRTDGDGCPYGADIVEVNPISITSVINKVKF